MSYRVCRKFTGSLFRVGDHLCKVFLDPVCEYRPGFYRWNVGFAVGKSRRQLNDWYRRKKNRRARTLNQVMRGKAGLTAISKGNDEVLKLRWNLHPGDHLVIDCTSRYPEKQFRAFKRWCKNRPEWIIDEELKEFTWYRPPYPVDPLRLKYKITGVIPDDPMICTTGRNYFKTFYFQPLTLYILLSNGKIVNQ